MGIVGSQIEIEIFSMASVIIGLKRCRLEINSLEHCCGLSSNMRFRPISYNHEELA